MGELVLSKVDKVYRSKKKTVHAVRSFDLTVKPGEIVALLGSSGCGKTSTLRMIAGFEEVTSGAITLESDDTVLWDWTVTRPNGDVDVYRVIMKFLDADRYTMSIDYRNPETPDVAWTPMISAMEFRRVDEAPEQFRQLKR